MPRLITYLSIVRTALNAGAHPSPFRPPRARPRNNREPPTSLVLLLKPKQMWREMCPSASLVMLPAPSEAQHRSLQQAQTTHPTRPASPSLLTRPLAFKVDNRYGSPHSMCSGKACPGCSSFCARTLFSTAPPPRAHPLNHAVCVCLCPALGAPHRGHALPMLLADPWLHHARPLCTLTAHRQEAQAPE